MSTETTTTENATNNLEVTHVMTETSGLTRQRLVTMKVTDLNPRNPVVAFTPGKVGLTRIDTAIVISYGSYVEGYWNKNKKMPEIIFDSYPEGGTFEFQLMVYGTQTR